MIAINRILHNEQIEQVLETLLINKPVKILRAIAKTGRNQSSVPWVYFQNEITGQKMSTFVSFDDVLKAFWIWLETAEVMLMALWKRIAISKVVWQFISTGELVHHRAYGWVEVVDKDFTEGKGIPRLWLAVGDEMVTAIACEVELF